MTPSSAPDRHPDRPTRTDLAELIRFALPIAAIQVGLMLMGVVDTIMVGRLSANALAAVAIANIYFFACSTVGMGCLYALDPVIAQAVGAGDLVAVGRGMQRGLVLALLVTVPTMIALAFVGPALRATHQPAAIIPPAVDYMRVIIPGIFPWFGFLVFRQTLQALGKLAPLVLVIIGANLLNVVANWVFIYGHWGSPMLGVPGAALATTLSRWTMFLGIAALSWRQVAHHLLPWRREALALKPLGRMAGIGLPIGFQILFEYGFFGVVGLLAGQMGAEVVAGHQISLNLAALSFMVPLGIGAAAAVLVGRAVGAGKVHLARRRAWSALLVSAGFMTLCAAAFVTIPGVLASAYTAEAPVVAIAASLLPLAGVFQVFDGTQAAALGVLRGVGDTKVPILVNVVGYYAIGLPVSVWLGLRAGWGVRGLWWGLVLGLAVVAAVLVARVRARLGQRLDRVQIDEPGGDQAAPADFGLSAPSQ